MNSQSNSISPDSGNNTFDMNSDDRVPDDENIEDNLDNFISNTLTFIPLHTEI